MDIVEHRSGTVPPPTLDDPARATRRLLTVIAAATAAVAVFTGVLAWDTHQQQAQNREIDCLNYSYDYDSGKPATYDKLQKSQQKIVDTLGCDIPGK